MNDNKLEPKQDAQPNPQVSQRPTYEAPRIMKKREVSRATLFTGGGTSGGGIVGGG